jgi:hypothetical protein
MNIDTGEIVHEEELRKLSEAEQARFVPVERDLTVSERFHHQIALYSPCGCGSGSKFKFCCHAKAKAANQQGNLIGGEPSIISINQVP